MRASGCENSHCRSDGCICLNFVPFSPLWSMFLFSILENLITLWCWMQLFTLLLFSQLSMEYGVPNYVFKNTKWGWTCTQSVGFSFIDLKRQDLKIEIISASSRLCACQRDYHLLMQILWGGGGCLHVCFHFCVCCYVSVSARVWVGFLCFVLVHRDIICVCSVHTDGWQIKGKWVKNII